MCSAELSMKKVLLPHGLFSKRDTKTRDRNEIYFRNSNKWPLKYTTGHPNLDYHHIGSTISLAETRLIQIY